MKKAIALVLTLTLLAIGCLSAGAATKSAFKQIDTYDGMPMQDNSPKNEKDIFYSDEFGIGNTGAGDWVMFSDVDFGTTGAKEVSLMFTFMVTDYSDFPCTLEIYLDDPDKGKPVGTVSIDEDCGHWMRDAAMWFKGKCDISGGVHDVYVKWKDNTGSLFAIKFMLYIVKRTNLRQYHDESARKHHQGSFCRYHRNQSARRDHGGSRHGEHHGGCFCRCDRGIRYHHDHG